MQTLQQLIQEARRELRRASGLPWTPQEIEEERRRTEMEAMDMFTFRTFRMRLMDALVSKTVWTEEGAAAEFKAEGRIYRLRKRGSRYVLFAVNDAREIELISLDSSDEQFANRVLVAIGDDMLPGHRG